MNRISKAIVISTALVIGGLSVASTASADEWRHHGWHGRHGGFNGGDAAALGIAGLAAGVIAGAIIADPGPRRIYEAPRVYDEPPVYEERRVYYREEAPVRYVRPAYAGSIQPWTRAWYNYCSDRYNSFNPRSGTYGGYDGQQHFCVAN